MTEAELKDLVAIGLKGPTRPLSAVELTTVMNFAASSKIAVARVECFEVVDDGDVPRIDLGIFGLADCPPDVTSDERIQIAIGDVEDMLRTARRNENPPGLLKYLVWFADFSEGGPDAQAG